MLTVHADHLTVTISNRTPKEIRLWELHNSWGWFSTSVEVKREPDSPIYTIRRAQREWTKNGPTYFSLPPGKKQGIRLDIHDGWWELDEVLLGWKEQPLSVRSRLRIETTPESERFGVYVGDVFSGWVASPPPHGWLFAQD